MKIQHAKFVVIGMTVAGLLALAALAWFVVLPTMRDVRTLADRIVQSETELQAQYANRKNLISSISQIDEAKKILTGLSTKYVAPGQELDFITGVEAVAETQGIEHDLHLTPVGKTGDDFGHTVDLTLTGPYQGVLRALVDIERMRYLIVFDRISVIGGSDGYLTMTIRGSVAAPPTTL